MKKSFLLTLICAVSACAQAPSNVPGKNMRDVKAENARTQKYQALVNKTREAQAALDDWLASEVNLCNAQGKVEGVGKQLQLTPQGRLVCQATPPPPPPAPAATPAPKPEDKK